ncbi:MAG: metalloregulator ArsR/SmtB family transcription factor [Rhodobacteraceae bacterium]|nr:metalloregulator ArsR/SmtB family transcription factor [Paracoccaceae bacterium]
METKDAALAFTTLGHPDRLAVFRLLMRFVPRGVRPTEIAEALGLKANTLSHHLADLAGAGLVSVERRGRSLFYAVDLDTTEALIGYLALDLGRGRPQLTAPLRGAAGEDRMPDRIFNVLFICSGNSARSIFAEALLRDLGQGRFRAFSAGTRPNSALNPAALRVLARNDHATSDLRSKHVSEFQSPDSPEMDFVFTVCDTAAAEECPPWRGRPITGHWGLPDPARAVGSEAEKGVVFARTYGALRRRIAAFAALPVDTLDRMALQQRVDALSRDPEE